MTKQIDLVELKKGSPWERTKYQYLIRYRPSGVYFARFKVGKKPFRFSLETTVVTVAQARLAERMKEKRASIPAKNLGRMLMRDAVAAYRIEFQSNARLKPSTKKYYEEVLAMVEKSWPGMNELEVAKITPAQVREWGTKLTRALSPNRFNNALSSMRHILDIAVEAGARHNNPAAKIKRMRQRPKKLTLPTREQFSQFVDVIEKAGGRFSHDCADFVSGLAFTGMRKGEGAMVELKDLNFDKDFVTVRGDEDTATKNWEVRRIPMIPEARALFLRMVEERKDEPKTAKLFKVREAQKSMDRAAAAVGMERITHHDLRHFFATICIESGVDIPTVSRWLGHLDGGALLMKTYGHLRDEHSFAQAQRVSFK